MSSQKWKWILDLFPLKVIRWFTVKWNKKELTPKHLSKKIKPNNRIIRNWFWRTIWRYYNINKRVKIKRLSKERSSDLWPTSKMCYLMPVEISTRNLILVQSSSLSTSSQRINSRRSKRRRKVKEAILNHPRWESLAVRNWNLTLVACLKWSIRIARIVGNRRSIGSCKVSSIKQLKIRRQICNILKLMNMIIIPWKHMADLKKKDTV